MVCEVDEVVLKADEFSKVFVVIDFPGSDTML